MSTSNSESQQQRRPSGHWCPWKSDTATAGPSRSEAPRPESSRPPVTCEGESPRRLHSQSSSCSAHSTWWGHGSGAGAAGRGLASQGAQGTRLRHGLHHHGAWRSQVGLPGGGHDLKDAACNHTCARAISHTLSQGADAGRKPNLQNHTCSHMAMQSSVTCRKRKTLYSQ